MNQQHTSFNNYAPPLGTRLKRRDPYGIQVPAALWSIPGGRVWEWVVSAPDEATEAGAPASPVPASYIQERHIRRAASNADAHGAAPCASATTHVWEAMSVAFDTPLDRSALGEVWRLFLERHDSLRSWFEVQEIPAISEAGRAVSKVVRHEVDPATLTWQLVEGPVFETGDQARDYLVQQFNTSTSPLAWPALFFAAVEHETGFTAVFAEDHSFCDGYSNLVAIAEFKALYTEQIGSGPAWLPDPGSQLKAAQEERDQLASLTLESQQTQNWIDYYHSLGGQLQRFPLPLDVDTTAQPGKMLMFDLLTEPEAQVLHQRSKEHGGGFVASVYAAFAATNYALGGQEQFNVLRAVSTRDDKHAYTQGWFINTVPVVFDLTGAVDFTDLVSRAQQAINASKDLTAVPIQRVIDLVAESMGETDSTGIPFSPPPMVSFIDIRLFPIWLATKETAYHKVVQPVPPTTAVFCWLNRYYDVLELVVYFPDNPTAEASVRRYAQVLAEVLRSVVETGGHPLLAPAMSRA